MKQIIVLVCSILLGVFIVNLIIGDDGIGTKAEQVWKDEYVYRSYVFENADK